MNNALGFRGGSEDTANYFITSWTSADGQIAVPVVAGVSYDFKYRVDGGTWIHYNAIPIVNHELVITGLSSVGTRVLEIDHLDNGLPKWSFNNTGDKLKNIALLQFGTNLFDTDGLEGGFYGCSNFTLSAIDTPQGITSGKDLFRDCTLLDFNFAAWDVSNWTDASGFCEGVTLSSSNYDNTLVSWESQMTQSGVTASFGGSKRNTTTSVNNSYYGLVYDQDWIIEDGGTVSATQYFEDRVPELSYAFCFKRVNATQTNCVRIRRSSDDAEMDFGFVSTAIDALLDVAAIEAWLGTDDGFVRTMYNPNGVGGIGSGIINSEQLIIAVGGVVYVDGNNIPYMRKEVGDTRWIAVSISTDIENKSCYYAFDTGVNYTTISFGFNINKIQNLSTVNRIVTSLSNVATIPNISNKEVFSAHFGVNTYTVNGRGGQDTQSPTTTSGTESQIFVGRFRTNDAGMTTNSGSIYGVFLFDTNQLNTNNPDNTINIEDFMKFQ